MRYVDSSAEGWLLFGQAALKVLIFVPMNIQVSSHLYNLGVLSGRNYSFTCVTHCVTFKCRSGECIVTREAMLYFTLNSSVFVKSSAIYSPEKHQCGSESQLHVVQVTP